MRSPSMHLQHGRLASSVQRTSASGNGHPFVIALPDNACGHRWRPSPGHVAPPSPPGGCSDAGRALRSSPRSEVRPIVDPAGRTGTHVHARSTRGVRRACAISHGQASDLGDSDDGRHRRRESAARRSRRGSVDEGCQRPRAWRGWTDAAIRLATAGCAPKGYCPSSGVWFPITPAACSARHVTTSSSRSAPPAAALIAHRARNGRDAHATHGAWSAERSLWRPLAPSRCAASVRRCNDKRRQPVVCVRIINRDALSWRKRRAPIAPLMTQTTGRGGIIRPGVSQTRRGGHAMSGATNLV